MNKIQLLFLGVLVSLVSAFVLNQYSIYENYEKEVEEQIVYINDLFAVTVSSVLHEKEMVLDSLISKLLADNAFKDTEQVAIILAKFSKRIKPSMGIALFSPGGESDIRYEGSEISTKQVLSLADREETSESFALTLKSNRMVLGRVYFHEHINKFVLPLRKAIRDDHNNVVAVVSTLLELESFSKFFHKKDFIPAVTSVVNAEGFWRVYVNPLKDEEYRRFYLNPLPEKYLDEILANIKRRYDLDNASFSVSQKSYIYKSDALICNNVESFCALRGLGHYGLWVKTAIPSSYVMTKFVGHGFYTRVVVFAVMIILLTIFFIWFFKKEKETKERLLYAATHDSLTDLYSRSAIEPVGSKWLNVDESRFSLVLIDLDNFKMINDTFGHSYGDLILREVAKRLKSFSLDGSDLFRHGGDEFFILLRETNNDSLLSFAESLASAVSVPYFVAGMTLHVSASLGVASFPQDGEDLEDLMMAADLAMYEAKRTRQVCCIYNSKLKEVVIWKASVERNLRAAISRGELYIVYQPQLCSSGDIHGVEALVRWQSAELGFVSPEHFVGIAEDVGLMEELGNFVVERSLADFAHIIKLNGDENLSLSINISAKQLLLSGFKEHLLHAVEASNLNKKNIVLEITESVFIDDIDYVSSLLQSIRDEGIKISLDDFGTGYSSFSMLRKLPVNELKIDRSFIQDIVNVEDAADVVKAIIGIGHNMNMHVVAEGVENIEQQKILNKYECDIYQGYYYSKPLKVHELLSYLSGK
ncbi:putative bifunctional diguanylate cyclase/phosphodiesterase [Maridesulfovibrio sp.]|uniref:putative bifunctional diguanylate cyclase/phosphodiesterase n=1 Tax=unclassified Maridesulfovibrio TaxID=2794999 RepID=UPI003B00EADE